MKRIANLEALDDEEVGEAENAQGGALQGVEETAQPPAQPRADGCAPREAARTGSGSVAPLELERDFYSGAVGANLPVRELHVQLDDFGDAKVAQGL